MKIPRTARANTVRTNQQNFQETVRTHVEIPRKLHMNRLPIGPCRLILRQDGAIPSRMPFASLLYLFDIIFGSILGSTGVRTSRGKNARISRVENPDILTLVGCPCSEPCCAMTNSLLVKQPRRERGFYPPKGKPCGQPNKQPSWI